MSHKIEKYAFVLLGSFVGAGIALLFAPQTGARTRKQIVKYGKKAGTRAQKFVGEIAESMDDVLGDILQIGEQGIDKGKQLTDKARGEILEVLDAGKKYIEDERTKLDRILK